MADRWDIDINHTRLGFSARHMMVTTVHGGFDKFHGYIDVDGDDYESASGEVIVQTASVNTGVEDRDTHLRSADFFDVEKYPEMRFVSTGIEKVGDDEYKVKGDLTIRDVTKPLELDVEIDGRINDPWGNDRVGLAASAKINRKDWGLTWNMALEAGGLLLSDQVKLEIEATMTRALEAAA